MIESKYLDIIKEFADNTDIIICILRGSKFAYANQALQRNLGYSLEELYAMDFWDVIHPEFRDLGRERGLARQRGEELQESYELQLLGKEENSFWVHLKARYTSIEGEPAVIVSAFDINERKAMEADLLRQKESLQLMLENNPVATALVNPEGKTLYVNPRFIEYTGYNLEEVSSSQVWEEKVLSEMPHRQEIMKTWYHNLKERGYSKGKIVLRRRDGERRFFNIHSVSLPDGHIILAAWDISDQVEARKILQESEARFKALSEASFEGIIISENGICIEANQAAEKLFGYSREELIGLNVMDFTAPEAREIVKSQMMSASQAPYEAVALRQDGSRVPVEIQGRDFIYQGREVRAAAIRDLSERRRAEEEIYRQSTNLQALFYNTPDGVVLCDAEHGVLDINPRFMEHFGYNIEECRGCILEEVLVPEELREESAFMSRMVSSGQANSRESVRKKKNGELLPVLVTMIPIASSGYYVLYTDISERKEAEATIQQQIEELEAKNAEMERFTYTVSHDLRSPLITIKGFSGLLLQDLEKGKTDRLQKDIQRIINASGKMEELLEDLLELSRIGRILNPYSKFPMNQLCHEVVELLSGPISQKKAEVAIAPYMPWVHGDRRRIAEVVQNLLENAIKFMGAEEHPRIEIGYFPSQGECGFFIKDNGIGIEVKYSEKVFGLFDKLDQNTEGTGIGLALVKRIIELHQGRIWVESAGAGQGSTIYFTLPAVPDSMTKGEK
ncbi:MAG: PAS domain S-box protein [Syntrophomonas sp.]|uniref:PAS domain-containing sensor histidine kinase n=1 Tax=Syntrophomonas sp. TaxID=2053627 RepID=UPI002629F811|nr:PAS domain-containing sensor histidine kinase [Syntrophomonas sp.]MDD3879708.1 PAS domain S-box protein [Syntrophomonas sp.]MDD4626783.1 PAS domain S-box protein [Syntrophomonas sp.]